MKDKQLNSFSQILEYFFVAKKYFKQGNNTTWYCLLLHLSQQSGQHTEYSQRGKVLL